MNGKGRAWVAIVLAFGVAIAIVALSVAVAYAESSKGRVVSTEAATLLSTALGAVVGALATYLGLHTAGEPSDLHPPEEESTEVDDAST